MSGGMDSASRGNAAELFPPDFRPDIASLDELRSQTALLRRIAQAAENRAPEQDSMRYVPPGLADGTITAERGPRLRIKRVYIAPVGTGEPVLNIGSESFPLGSIQAVPVPIDFPFFRVIQEGVDVFLWDASAPTTIPAFVGYLIGTTE